MHECKYFHHYSNFNGNKRKLIEKRRIFTRSEFKCKVFFFSFALHQLPRTKRIKGAKRKEKGSNGRRAKRDNWKGPGVLLLLALDEVASAVRLPLCHLPYTFPLQKSAMRPSEWLALTRIISGPWRRWLGKLSEPKDIEGTEQWDERDQYPGWVPSRLYYTRKMKIVWVKFVLN